MKKGTFSKREMLRHIGDFSQLFGVKDYILNGGKAGGTRAVDVKNGSGLEFTVLPDRCMDIAWLSYKGINFSYISKTGITAPQYYNSSKIEGLRSFYAGFLTTCGLSNVGSSCTEGDEEYGVHGRISNTPAEEVYAGTAWQDETAVMNIKGKMRQGRLFGENLVLEREITCKYGENKLVISDTVENCGFTEEPLMLLYHFNLGYPLLDEQSRLIIPGTSVTPRDEDATIGVDNYYAFQPPTQNYKEQVFYHELEADEQGNTFAGLINPELDIGVKIKFNKNELKKFVQWKQMGESEYVLGIEPSTCHVRGRKYESDKGALEYIKPGEVRHFNIEVEIIDGINKEI